MEITEIARDENRAYGISFVVCTNNKLTQQLLGIEGDDHSVKMATNHAQLNAMQAISDAGFDYEIESSFAKYNGSPYSRFIHLCWHVADIVEAEGFDEDEQHLITDDDTRDEWEPAWLVGAGATDIPNHVVAKAEAVQDAAEQKARDEAERMLETLK